MTASCIACHSRILESLGGSLFDHSTFWEGLRWGGRSPGLLPRSAMNPPYLSCFPQLLPDARFLFLARPIRALLALFLVHLCATKIWYGVYLVPPTSMHMYPVRKARQAWQRELVLPFPPSCCSLCPRERGRRDAVFAHLRMREGVRQRKDGRRV